MRGTAGHPEADWSIAAVEPSSAAAHARDIQQSSHHVQTHVSIFARARRQALGKLVALAGSFNIVLGAMFADQQRTGRGHRQRVVGMLQFNCDVDHRTANAFVDRWLAKRALLPHD